MAVWSGVGSNQGLIGAQTAYDRFRDRVPSGTPRTPTGKPILHPDQVVRALLGAAQRVFVNPDLAWRQEREYQRQMRNDPDVQIALEQRLLAVALLPWEIEPEDKEDPAQQAEARAIEKAIRGMKYLTQMLRQLCLATWYGHAAVNCVYRKLDRPLMAKGGDDESTMAGCLFVPHRWMPIHPDTMLFTFEGEPVIRVNLGRYHGDSSRIVLTEDGPAVRLSPDERAATVVNVSRIEGADYDIPYEASKAYSGFGLRGMLYQTWYMKQRVLQMSVRYGERLGAGAIVGRYPSGNSEAKAAIEAAILNIIDDVAVAIPTGAGDEKEQYGLDFVEPAGTGAEIFWRLLNEYFGPQITKSIIGQTLSSDTAPTGLGSGVAQAHENTFWRIIAFDVATLEDSVTSDLVDQIRSVNFPASTNRPRFKLLLDKVDPDAYLEAVQKFVNMGGVVDEDELRRTIGLARPRAGAATLGHGGAGLDPDADPLGTEGRFGGGPGGPGADEAADADLARSATA